MPGNLNQDNESKNHDIEMSDEDFKQLCEKIRTIQQLKPNFIEERLEK